MSLAIDRVPTLHRQADGHEMLLVKGAPEVVLDHCDRQQSKSREPASIDRDHFAEAADRLAAQGERVLALAWLETPGLPAGNLSPTSLPKKPVLLGLIGFLDPPREEAIEAVKECHGGGIRVTMITGDHKITAAADVFTRASPEHKLRLVKAIQANREIVAMTGEGSERRAVVEESRYRRRDGYHRNGGPKEAAGMVFPNSRENATFNVDSCLEERLAYARKSVRLV
jgi:magnesium-transporting ATPase (P-type)